VDWRTKSRIQKAFSAVPGGHRLNYLLQRFVTHSLPRRGAALEEVVATAQRHLVAIEEHTATPRDDLRFFEFGAGYDLSESLAFAALGVRHQVLYDIRPVARPAMVRSASAELRGLGLDLPAIADGRALASYLDQLGIEYVAPADARATELAPGSIDVCTTTSVLEHIPVDDLRAILAEVRRILAPTGLCSFAVDYHDHYAGADTSIDGLNFLRFDDREWTRWNCGLQYQNRLRHGDYVALFEAAGFDLVAVDAVEDPSFPERPVVAERFEGRPDLAIGDGWFVLAPVVGSAPVLADDATDGAADDP
jgi:SAM-dependent methyltransferase